MSNIVFKPVTSTYDKLDDIKRIYEEAFPENERELSIDGIINTLESKSAKGIYGVEEDGRLVAFVVAMDRGDYSYFFFLAVDNSLRGGGYGTKIMQEILSLYKDKTMLFDIETPIESAPNNEQRIRRWKFYERLGLMSTGVSFDYGDDNYTFFTNNMSDKLNDYIQDYTDNFIAKGKMNKKL